MLLAIHMPQWLTDFWTIYGEMITPILVTLLTTIMTYFVLKIKKDNVTNAAKTDAQLLVMKELASKEDNKKELNALQNENKELRNSLALVSDMIVELSKNVNIEPEIKDKIEALGNKSKYGTGLEIITKLEETNVKLVEEVKKYKEDLQKLHEASLPKAKEIIKKIRN